MALSRSGKLRLNTKEALVWILQYYKHYSARRTFTLFNVRTLLDEYPGKHGVRNDDFDRAYNAAVISDVLWYLACEKLLKPYVAGGESGEGAVGLYDITAFGKYMLDKTESVECLSGYMPMANEMP